MSGVWSEQPCNVYGRTTYACKRALKMDSLHSLGVSFIELLQHTFSNYENHMFFMSHMGDPRNAFLIYFPVVFCFSPNAGQRVLWVAALAEWLNAILKWLLYGQRPYWWVHETSIYGKDNVPDLHQFPLTCETGPGSPSGHAMVTASVWFVMVTAFTSVSNKSKQPTAESNGFKSLLSWLLFTGVMVMVSTSRLFIATHFPHQVLFGTVVGMILAYICNHAPLEDLKLHNYIIGSVCIISTSVVLYFTLQSLGFNPGWSVSLAMKWCIKSEYIHLDTTPFYALSRDAGCVLGLGVILISVGSRFPDALRGKIDVMASLIAALCCFIYCRAIEMISLPQENILLFYTYGFLKNSLIPIGVVSLRCLVASLICKQKNH
ncbi:glucose-6-phosphatase 2-like [Ptychodera flava]|uniref:glucose-6-phosphatase 2-like n=1 Tax=Ptychodera flava TaxID=63121 RepID=UPI00396A3F57